MVKLSLKREWWIYYGNGAVISYKDCSPFAVPRTDVQVIIQEYEDGYCLTFGKDWYYWDDGWWPTDELTSWLTDCPSKKLQILRGKNCKEFKEIKNRAIAFKKTLIEGTC